MTHPDSGPRPQAEPRSEAGPPAERGLARALVVCLGSVAQAALVWSGIAAPAALPALLAWSGIEAPGAMTVLLAGQAILGAALVLSGGILYHLGERSPLFFLFVLSGAALGPLGIAGTGLAALLRLAFARRATPFADWYASLFPRPEIDRVRALHDLIAIRNGGPPERDSVMSFGDVLALGTIRQKQVVVSSIADHFRPAFAPVLRGALNDPEPAIRVLAASAAARIENRFAASEADLRRQVAARADDPQARFALARHLGDYADTGLMDASRAAEIRRTALGLVEEAALRAPDDAGVAGLAGVLLLSLGRAEEAATRLEPWTRRGYPSMGIIVPYLEALYALRRFAALREACARFGRLPGVIAMPAEVGRAVRLWAPVEASARKTPPAAARPGHGETIPAFGATGAACP